MADTLTIVKPVEFQTYQRDGSDQADIPITGTFTGSAPTNVEANFAGAGYVRCDSLSIDGSDFSCTLSSASAGSGSLIVRDEDATAANDTITIVRIGDIFLVGPGQSNAVGLFDGATVYTESEGGSLFRADGAWKVLEDHTDSDPVAASGSIWPLVANYVTASTGYPIAFITAATGGVGMRAWRKGNSNYTALVQQVTDSEVNDLAGVLMYGGESDVIDERSYYSVRGWMENIVADLTEDLSLTCPMILANIADISSETGKGDAADTVRRAFQDLWDNHSSLYVGPTGADQEFQDGLHWKSVAEATVLAGRWWAAINEACYGGASGSARGPQISSYELTNSTTVTVTLDKTITNPGVAYTPGIFSINGSAPSSAVYSTSTTVVLTLSETTTSISSFTYASGHSASGATVIKGNDTYTLPADPYFSDAIAPQYASVFFEIKTGSTAFASQGNQTLLSNPVVNVVTSINNRYIRFGIDSDGKPYVEFLLGGTTPQRVTGEALSVSSLYVIGFIYNGTSWSIRINGANSSTTGSVTRTFQDVYGRTHVIYGAHHTQDDRSDIGDYYEGFINTIKGYDVKVSASDISQIEAELMENLGI